jgi:hypothetical protein
MGVLQLAVSRISARNRSGPSTALFGVQDVDRDSAAVPQVLGEVHRGHPAGAELALDHVAVGQSGF